MTITVEDHGAGPDIHVHAGGQGLWQARLLESFQVETTLVTALIGETGALLGHILRAHEGTELLALERAGRGAAYVHDRRSGTRSVVAETVGDVLTRHEIDDLFGLALRAGITADAAILSGPDGDIIPPDTYRRLAADLGAVGSVVVADLAGDRLKAVLEGGVYAVKVSDEELIADGYAADDSDAALRIGLQQLLEAGAERAIVSRADGSTLAGDQTGTFTVSGPTLQVVDSRGSGDSLTAAVTAALVAGDSFPNAVRLGVAAGAVNVTRHGLAESDQATIRALLPHVHVKHDDKQR